MVRGRHVQTARGVATQAGGQRGLFRRTKLFYQGHVYAVAIHQSVSL